MDLLHLTSALNGGALRTLSVTAQKDAFPLTTFGHKRSGDLSHATLVGQFEGNRDCVADRIITWSLIAIQNLFPYSDYVLLKILRHHERETALSGSSDGVPLSDRGSALSG